MLLADVTDKLVDLGVTGIICIVLVTWLTGLGKWITTKFTKMIEDSNAVIQRNTDAMESWKRNATNMTEALTQFSNNSTHCREGVKEYVDIIARRLERIGAAEQAGDN